MPEKMNIKAANKFLKLLEEPPNKTVLLLVSEDKGLIIDTILSRLQHTRIPSYTVSDTVENSKAQKSESFLNFCRFHLVLSLAQKIFILDLFLFKKGISL